MAEIKIRPLIRKDRVILAGMVTKLSEKIGDKKLLNMIVADTSATPEQGNTKDTAFISIGVQVLKMMIETLENDVASWFASLIGCTPEELNNMPVDIELKIIEQLIESEEANNFFIGALHLSRKIQGLVNRSKEKKTQ
jgi:hypothetical protein